jgi:uncharacterized membrane protein
MKRFIDGIMWLMFLATFIISILTMTVTFGIQYTGLEFFATLLPLEISLGTTLVFWGINSVINPYLRHGRGSIYLLITLGAVLLAFVKIGLY